MSLTSDPRVLLEVGRVVPIRRITDPTLPPAANSISLVPPSRLDGLLDHVRLALEDLERQPAGSMPGDMAVQDPDARVVGLEGDGNVAALGQEDDVSAGRVVEVEDVGVLDVAVVE